MNKSIFAVLTLATSSMACSLDASGKMACDGPSDCLDGYDCAANTCVARGQGSGPTTALLHAPSNLQGTYVGTDYRLTWQDNSQNETGFEVERNIGASLLTSFSLLGTTGSDTTEYVTRFYKNEPHRFRVRAVNEQGRSEYSDELFVTSPTLTVVDPALRPSRPVVDCTSKTSSMGTTTYTLRWSAADFRGQTEDCGYNIYERDYLVDEAWSATPIATLSQEVLSHDVTPVFDFDVEYGVAAFNSFGESEYGTVRINPFDTDRMK